MSSNTWVWPQVFHQKQWMVRVSGVMHDKRIARMKAKVYKTEVRPFILYFLMTVELTKRQDVELEVEDHKIQYFFIGKKVCQRDILVSQ